MTQADLSGHRPNVGIVLFNREGRVWLGRRVGTPEPYNWQFPQGGVDEGEDLFVAALRELEERPGSPWWRLWPRPKAGSATAFRPAAVAPDGRGGCTGQK